MCSDKMFPYSPPRGSSFSGFRTNSLLTPPEVVVLFGQNVSLLTPLEVVVFQVLEQILYSPPRGSSVVRAKYFDLPSPPDESGLLF